METINPQLEQKVLLTILEHPKKRIRLKTLAETGVEDFGSDLGIEVRQVMEDQIQRNHGLGTALDFAELPSLSSKAQNWIKATPKRRKQAIKRSEDQVDGLITKLKMVRRVRVALEGLEQASSIIMREKVTDKDLDQFSSVLEDTLTKSRSGMDLQPMLHLGKDQSKEDLQEIIESTLYQERKTSFIPTGIDALDQAYGGFAKGNVVTISANSGGGKTAMALNMSTGMAKKGVKVHYCSLEMTQQETLDRVVSHVAQLDHDKIRLGMLSDQEKKKGSKSIKKFWKRLRKLAARFTIWDVKEEFTPQQLEIAVKALGYDCVIVDYITLFSSKNMDTWKMQMEYSRFLKKMAKRLNVVVIILTQLTEDDQIKYGRSIKENTDYWFYWKYGDEEEQEEQTELKTGKARHSKKKSIQLHMQLAQMTITGTLEELPVASDLDPSMPPITNSKEKRKKGEKSRSKGKKKSRTQRAIDELDSFS